jgi:hypothetical protein
VSAGRDVNKHQLVGALLVIAQRQLARIAHIAQLARLSFAELHAAGHLTVMNVQTRNDTFS